MENLLELQSKAYKKDNFKIVLNDDCKECVAIYFTSNDLFYPHNSESFTYSVLQKDFYEWQTCLLKRANKHVFLRDIYKQWYCKGINQNINSIDSLFLWLKDQTKGYKEIVTIGSSAGGYMSALMGTMLGANISLAFNAQFDLWSSIEKNGKIISPMLRELEKSGNTKYFSIYDKIKNNSNIFYFFSTGSSYDVAQYAFIKDLNSINILKFKTAHHGIPFLKSAVSDVINMDKCYLLRLSNKIYTPFKFSVEIIGLFPCFVGLFDQVWKKLKKRYKA